MQIPTLEELQALIIGIFDFLAEFISYFAELADGLENKFHGYDSIYEKEDTEAAD